MADAPQGPQWWQASDGRWYPPQPTGPGGPPPPSSGAWKGCLIAFAIVVVLSAVGVVGCAVFIGVTANELEDAADDFTAELEARQSEVLAEVDCAVVGVDVIDQYLIEAVISNRTSSRSDYTIEYVVRDRDGARIGSAADTITNVEPGEVVTEEVSSGIAAVGSSELATCEVVQASRRAS